MDIPPYFEASPPPLPVVRQVPPRRSVREPRPTWKVAQDLPEASGMLEPPEPDLPPPPARAPRVLLRVTEKIRTVANRFGLSRIYNSRPSRIPDSTFTVAESFDPTAGIRAAKKSRTQAEVIAPYPNLSTWRYDHDYWNGGETKTIAGRARQLRVMTTAGFNNDDLKGVNLEKINAEVLAGADAPWSNARDGWTQCSITIGIPLKPKPTQASERLDANLQRRAARHETIPRGENGAVEGTMFSIPGFFKRSIPHIIKTTFGKDPAAKDFHTHPFKERYLNPDAPPSAVPETVYGEIYASQAMREVHDEIQRARAEPGCTLPKIVAALLIWSDGTHVAQFGVAKVWPIYLFFGNQSKYMRGKPSSRAAHHLAYLPSVHLSFPVPYKPKPDKSHTAPG